MRQLLNEFRDDGFPSLSECIEREIELNLYCYQYCSISKSDIDGRGVDIEAICQPWGWRRKEFTMTWGFRPADWPDFKDDKKKKTTKAERAAV